MAEITFHKVLSKHSTVYDTLEAIIDTINANKTSEFCKRAAKEFGPTGDKLSYIKRVYNWICNNVEYKEDFPGVEVIYTPQLVVLAGESDCKKHTILFSAILAAAGIEPVLKHVYYSGRTDISHIYTIVPMPDLNHYIACDTTICDFGAEVDYAEATLYFLNGQHMELHMMGNRGDMKQQAWMACCGFNENFSSIGAAAVHKISPLHHAEVLKKLLPNKPGLAEHLQNISIQHQRGAFLELLDKNANGLATHLAVALGKDPNALNSIWHTVGGDLNHLKEMVIKGATKPAEDINEMKIGGWFKHLLHAAAGILHAVAPVVGAILGPGAASVVNNIADKAENIAQSAPVKDASKPGGLAPPPPNITPDPTGLVIPPPHELHDGDGKIFGMPPLMAAGVLAGIIFLISK